MAEQTAARVVFVRAQRRIADVRAEDIHATATGTRVHPRRRRRAATTVRLRILGEHHVSNALAAHRRGPRARRPDRAGDRRASRRCRAPSAGAWRCSTRGDGVIVINDAYNASPDSTAAALKTLAQIVAPGPALGRRARRDGRARRVSPRRSTTGSAGWPCGSTSASSTSWGSGARHIHAAAGLEGSWDGESVFVADVDRAYDLLREELRAGDVVLVKSSKSAGLRFLGDRLGGVDRDDRPPRRRRRSRSSSRCS